MKCANQEEIKIWSIIKRFQKWFQWNEHGSIRYEVFNKYHVSWSLLCCFIAVWNNPCRKLKCLKFCSKWKRYYFWYQKVTKINYNFLQCIIHPWNGTFNHHEIFFGLEWIKNHVILSSSLLINNAIKVKKDLFPLSAWLHSNIPHFSIDKNVQKLFCVVIRLLVSFNRRYKVNAVSILPGDLSQSI